MDLCTYGPTRGLVYIWAYQWTCVLRAYPWTCGPMGLPASRCWLWLAALSSSLAWLSFFDGWDPSIQNVGERKMSIQNVGERKMSIQNVGERKNVHPECRRKKNLHPECRKKKNFHLEGRRKKNLHLGTGCVSFCERTRRKVNYLKTREYEKQLLL